MLLGSDFCLQSDSLGSEERFLCLGVPLVKREGSLTHLQREKLLSQWHAVMMTKLCAHPLVRGEITFFCCGGHFYDANRFFCLSSRFFCLSEVIFFALRRSFFCVAESLFLCLWVNFFWTQVVWGGPQVMWMAPRCHLRTTSLTQKFCCNFWFIFCVCVSHFFCVWEVTFMMPMESLFGGPDWSFFGVHKLSLLTCAVLSHLSYFGSKRGPVLGYFSGTKSGTRIFDPYGAPPLWEPGGAPGHPTGGPQAGRKAGTLLA